MHFLGAVTAGFSLLGVTRLHSGSNLLAQRVNTPCCLLQAELNIRRTGRVFSVQYDQPKLGGAYVCGGCLCVVGILLLLACKGGSARAITGRPKGMQL